MSQGAVPNVPQQCGPIHNWHPHVGDDYVETGQLARLQGGLATHSKLHAPAIPVVHSMRRMPSRTLLSSSTNRIRFMREPSD